MKFSNDTILNESAATASANGEAVDIRLLFGFSAQITWTSTTAAATVVIQGSNDKQNWVDIATAATIANNSGTAMYNSSSEQYYGWMRVRLVYTSGSVTTVSAILGAKGV